MENGVCSLNVTCKQALSISCQGKSNIFNISNRYQHLQSNRHTHTHTHTTHTPPSTPPPTHTHTHNHTPTPLIFEKSSRYTFFKKQCASIFPRSDDIATCVKNHAFEKITFKDLTLRHIVPNENTSKVLT